jgi:hypothetical protein
MLQQTTLLSGLNLVPPKFFGQWNIIILLFALAAKIIVSFSSTRDPSFSSCNLQRSGLKDVAESGCCTR